MTGSVYAGVTSPCYLLEEKKLKANLELVNEVQKRSGCEVILALKGFAMWSAFPLIKQYLKGCSASSYNEARLAREHFNGHVHLYAPAYRDEEFDALVELSDRISFNSLSQWQRFSGKAIEAGISCGIRVNPLIDEVETALYNPSGPQSRLGIAPEEFDALPADVEGLHVHALCENDAESTVRLIEAVEYRFGQYLDSIKWLNLGGGHLMTRAGYDVELLVNTLTELRNKYPHLDIILEPGSAIAWDTGPLVSSVLDIVKRGGIEIAILDISATAHMPDVLEMPYRPSVRFAAEPESKHYTYRLGGMSCLAGDIVGDYSFDKPLEVGDQIIFEDMMHYTMVKTTMFNGVQHPCIAILKEDGSVQTVRRFGYEDYEKRLS